MKNEILKLRNIDGFCFSIDSEWANEKVIGDLLTIFNEYKIPITLFCTNYLNVKVNEYGIHPNFHIEGDYAKKFLLQQKDITKIKQNEIYRYALNNLIETIPDVKGVRTHCQHLDSELIWLFEENNLIYDSSISMLFQDSKPFLLTPKLIEFPIYYADHPDIIYNMTDFNINKLMLDKPGLKIFDFHPNIVYINADNDNLYRQSKVFYHNPEGLKKFYNHKKGIRTLLIELLDYIVKKSIPCFTIKDAFELIKN